MNRKQVVAELQEAIQALDETIRKARKDWNREIRRTKELLKELEAPD